MKTFGITDYTNLAPLKCCRRMDRREKYLSLRPINNERDFMKHAQKRKCISSMYEQSLGKV